VEQTPQQAVSDSHMNKIEYIENTKKELDVISPLWEKLREYHKVRSKYFKKYFDDMTWKIRKKELLDKSGNGMLIHLAKDNKSGNLIGYCVSTINKNKVGEIDSIFIEDDYRRSGIGKVFMKRALEWMDSKSVIRKNIAVDVGNEEVLGFYSKFKFYPRIIFLTQANKK
jgi:GNAT superfamily N-acetyltransferase